MAKIDESGRWYDRSGNPVHLDLIRLPEKLKDETVEGLIAKAMEREKELGEFRKYAEGEVAAYFSLLLEKYGVDERSNSKKGNLTLENYSATAKVEIRIQETLSFDERLQVAKLKIDEYLKDATKNSSPEIQILISKAFEVDKTGKVDAKKIFGLKAYDIQDVRWKQAMEIIDEAKQVSKTTPYIRFYTREDISQKYRLVALDIASA